MMDDVILATPYAYIISYIYSPGGLVVCLIDVVSVGQYCRSEQNIRRLLFRAVVPVVSACG